jgi:hypothetical protein
MHDNDHPVSPHLARRLITNHMADLAALPLRRVSGGKENMLYRLGSPLP